MGIGTCRKVKDAWRLHFKAELSISTNHVRLALGQSFRIKRKPRGEVRNALLHFLAHFFRFRRVNHFRNQTSYLMHLRLFHSACGDCLRVNAQI